MLINNNFLLFGYIYTILLFLYATRTMATDNKNSEMETKDNNNVLEIVTRDEWMARPAGNQSDKLNLPVHRVIILHTASETCTNKETCSIVLGVIETFHMDSMEWNDIGYNFLIGGDGLVYEGRGWDIQGAHTKGYNVDSIGIGFVGTFTIKVPTQAQLDSAQLLIEEGVRQQKLVPDYRLYGQRQLTSSESPGLALYNIIKTWKNWSA